MKQHLGFCYKSKPVTEWSVVGNRRRLLKDFEFQYDGVTYIIPKYTCWDGASIPRLFWSLIGSPFHVDNEVAGLIHDWLYRTQSGKIFADTLFFKCLIIENKRVLHAYLMYLCVKWFGGSSYKNYERKI